MVPELLKAVARKELLPAVTSKLSSIAAVLPERQTVGKGEGSVGIGSGMSMEVGAQ